MKSQYNGVYKNSGSSTTTTSLQENEVVLAIQQVESETNDRILLRLWDTQHSRLGQINSSLDGPSIHHRLEENFIVLSQEEMRQARINRFSPATETAGSRLVSSSARDTSLETPLPSEAPTINFSQGETPLITALNNVSSNQWFGRAFDQDIDRGAFVTAPLNTINTQSVESNTFYESILNSINMPTIRNSSNVSASSDPALQESFRIINELDDLFIREGIRGVGGIDPTVLENLRSVGQPTYLHPLDIEFPPMHSMGDSLFLNFEVSILHIFNMLPNGLIFGLAVQFGTYLRYSPNSYVMTVRLLYRLRGLFYSFVNIFFWRTYNVRTITTLFVRILNNIRISRLRGSSLVLSRRIQVFANGIVPRLTYVVESTNESFRRLNDIANNSSFYRNFYFWLNHGNSLNRLTRRVGGLILVSGITFLGNYFYMHPQSLYNLISFITRSISSSPVDLTRAVTQLTENIPRFFDGDTSFTRILSPFEIYVNRLLMDPSYFEGSLDRVMKILLEHF